MERDAKLSETGLFKHGMPYLAPKQRITLFLTSIVGQTAEISRPAGRFNVEVTVKYRGILGASYEHKYPLDLKHLLGLTTIGNPPLQTMAKELEKIRKSLGNLESGWKRLKVDSFSAKDRERERLDWEDQRSALVEQGEQMSDEIELPIDPPGEPAAEPSPSEGGESASPAS